MNILALDTGSITGWAMLYSKKIYSGTQDFSKKKCDDNGVSFIFFRSWLEAMLKTYRPEVIIFEQPHMRGAGTQLLMGFVTTVQELATEYPAMWIEVHSKTLKIWATGYGNSTKDQMMEKAREKKWKFVGDDECDALWILDWYISKSAMK